MNLRFSTHRQTWMLSMLTLAAFLIPSFAYAQSGSVELILQPHCSSENGERQRTNLFGPVPHPHPMIRLGTGGTPCDQFRNDDPQTLKTSPLSRGDTLDIDIIIKNEDEIDISSVRAWLSYDPSVLQGLSIEIGDDFRDIIPGEKDFDTSAGYAMIGASAREGDEPDKSAIRLARVKFSVLDTPAGGTAISFYDVQSGGHTDIKGAGDGENDGPSLLRLDPSSLRVLFTRQDGETCSEDDECLLGRCDQGICRSGNGKLDGESCVISSECLSGVCTSGVCGNEDRGSRIEGQPNTNNQPFDSAQGKQPTTSENKPTSTLGTVPNGGACNESSECGSYNCVNGTCEGFGNTADGFPCSHGSECQSGVCENNQCIGDGGGTPTTLLPDGSFCSADSECSSGTCSDGFCGAPIESFDSDLDDTLGTGGSITEQTTAFGLLQVRGLRVTTEGEAVYLAWDALESSRLKAYNVYYGTTSGRYIQRKTVQKDLTSLTLKPLPLGTTYFFAIRGVSNDDEESAFSDEVGISVGDPESSTSPLDLSSDIAFDNPVDEGDIIPGETGAGKMLLIFLTVAAVLGTYFASRRQILLTKPTK